jgi:hypothetical protein
MVNYALVSLASKLSFLQFNWGFESTHFSALMMVYQSFMIEVGLYRNTMDYYYMTHSMLAMSGSWFKNIWELVWHFNVWTHVSTAFQLVAVQQGDISLMSDFMCTGHFCHPDLISLNIMSMHKKIIHKLDIVLCDGITIKAEMLTDQPGHSGIHTFPIQHPTPADLNLWKLGLRKLSSNFHVFMVKLQEYISPPHNHPRWMLNNIGTILHHNVVQGDKTYHEEYSSSSNPIDCRTRAGQHFNSTIVKDDPSNFDQYASITPSQLGQVLLHSLVLGFIPLRSISGFEHVIKSSANQSLWLSLDWDGDGSWILDGKLAQSLVIIHDGSYMKEVLTHISLAATMIYCRIAKAQCKCMWAKQLASASSYHGEILGGIMTQSILNAAASKCHDAIPLVVVGCDNNGVVSHGNEPLRPFPTNQSQADICRIFKNLFSAQPFCIRYKYMQSHADDTKRWQDCSLKEQINIKVDCLAKKALMAARSTGKCIKSVFPNEQIWISMGGER